MRTNTMRQASWVLAALLSPKTLGAADMTELCETRARHVAELSLENGAHGVGVYGVEMSVLVGAGYVEMSKGWKDPKSATWTGLDGVNSEEDFLASPDAQKAAYAFYLESASEAVVAKKPNISFCVDGIDCGVREMNKLVPYAKPFEIAAFLESGDSRDLDEAAQRNGMENGDFLAKTAISPVRENVLSM